MRDGVQPVSPAPPLGGDAVRVLAVVVVAAARALVGAALLSHHVQTLQINDLITNINNTLSNLSPLVILGVTGVVGPGLLSEVGEHGGQGPPAHVVRLGLRPLISTDSGELPYCLESRG